MSKLSFIPSLIVYDFDGVMTDNRAFVDENGNEGVFVHRGDGYGVRMIKDGLNIPQIILSTEDNPVVRRRAEKLKIPVIHGVGDEKSEVLRKYCAENGFSLNNVMYVGNDLNDFEAMLLCGYKICPIDAEPEIVFICNHVINVKGGYGVIRMLYHTISALKADMV